MNLAGDAGNCECAWCSTSVTRSDDSDNVGVIAVWPMARRDRKGLAPRPLIPKRDEIQLNLIAL